MSPLPVEVDEDVDDALATLIVHSEGGTIPVAGSTEALELLEDDTPMLARPVPSVLEEGFARQVVLLDALSCQTADDLRSVAIEAWSVPGTQQALKPR